jgi:hypothetical protein
MTTMKLTEHLKTTYYVQAEDYNEQITITALHKILE